MKVLGCKVSDEIYDQFASYGCISDTLRGLVMDFLNKKVELQVNRTNSTDEGIDIRDTKLQACYRFLEVLNDS